MKQPGGVIYILTNPSFPDYVKIGYAHDLEKRLKQLNRSESVPFAFRAYAVYKVNADLRDIDLHRLIDKLNPDLRSIETFNGKTRVREFYAMTKESAYELLECIAKISGTEDHLMRVKATGTEVADEKKASDIEKDVKRGPFRFSMCSIPAGSELVYINDPEVIATVVDDRHIRYQNEVVSLSSLAEQLQNKKSLQGPKFFTYHGELLVNIRDRLEKAKTGISK